MNIVTNKIMKLSMLTFGFALVLASCTSANATTSSSSNNNNTKTAQAESTEEDKKAAAVNSKVKSNAKTPSVMRMDSKAASMAVKKRQTGVYEEKK